MKTTLKEIAAAIVQMVNTANIYTTNGLQELNDIEEKLSHVEMGSWASSIYLNFRQAWGVEASICINHLKITEHDRRGTKYHALTFDIEINGPTSTYSISTMNAKIALLRKVTDLASLIDSAFNGVEIDLVKKPDSIAP